MKDVMKMKINEQNAILNVALAEKRAMSEEEQDKFDNLDTEINNLKRTIEAQSKLEAREIENKTVVNKPEVVEIVENDKPFKNLGEQLMAIVKSSMPGAKIDNRLLQVRNATGSSEGVPSDGGFLVQKDFTSEIIKNVYATGILAPMCRKIPISANSNGVKINGVDESSRADGSRWGGVRGYWANEAGTVTATKPQFRQIELTLNKLMALYYSTEELLQDSAAMESILSQAFTEELQFKLDDSIIRGTGAGQPLGILNAGCLVSVPKESGQAADTILFENILNMWSRMLPKSRANAVWIINQEIEPQLFSLSFPSGTASTPVYMPAGGLSGSMYGTLFGRPVMTIEQASALGDVGDIMLVDMSKYLLADKTGMQMASSMHVQFIYDEMTFRVTYRVDGQPVLNTAITPFKGSKTLSSFVTLAERS